MAPLRVMIVEDEPIIAMLLAHVLVGMGHTVCATVATEVDAVATAARLSPGLILVDARLLRGDGYAAMATILRQGFVPHVFMSGAPRPAEGMDPRAGFLTKPFGDSDLAAAMRRAVVAA